MKHAGILGGIVGVGVLIAGGVAGTRRTLRDWANNPDPLHGVSPRMPDGERSWVSTDDGASIAVDFYHPPGHANGRVLMFVHGLTATRHDWAPISRHLLDTGCTVITVEQRGHGDSTVGSVGFGSERLGDDLAVVVEQLDQRIDVLVGHSMGGMAVMAFASRHPNLSDQVRALGLIATTASLQSKRAQALLRLAAAPLPDSLTESRHLAGNDLVRLAAGKLAYGARPSLHLVDSTLELALGQDSSDRIGATVGLLGHDLRDAIGHVSQPTLVVAGVLDQMVPLDDVTELADLVPGAVFVSYPDAGHMVIWEEHEAIANELFELANRELVSVTGCNGTAGF